MSDLSEYFSKDDRIKELELELADITRKYNNEMTYTSKWKAKYYSVTKGKPRLSHPVVKSRTSKAKVLIKAWQGGDRSLSLQQIADQVFLSYETIKAISSNLRRKL
jgi:DNA-binding NarL/FixJ family response regulator